MPKSTFIPAGDHDFLVWMEHFIANLTPATGATESDLAALKAASADFRDKTIHTNDTAALAKQATADKNASRESVVANTRAIVRQIKAGSNYSEGQGAQLGIVGPERTQDLATSHPDLSGIDQTGGRVALSFTKYKSEGVNIYSQRENDADWVLLARATVSPFVDNRPFLQTG